MCIAVIGGMDRLKQEYINNAQKFGIQLKIFTAFESNLKKKIGQTDMVIILSNKISHKAKREAMNAIKKGGIPFMLHHACGISSFNVLLSNITSIKFNIKE